jgi:hypothetical protein
MFRETEGLFMYLGDCKLLKSLAPQVGFEPTTLRLTDVGSTIFHRYKQGAYTLLSTVWAEPLMYPFIRLYIVFYPSWPKKRPK